jgi:hypothetical protein
MRAYRSPIAGLDGPERRRWKSVGTDRAQDRWVEPGIPNHACLDGVGDAVLAPDLVEQLGENARLEPMDRGDGTLPTQSADGIVSAR